MSYVMNELSVNLVAMLPVYMIGQLISKALNKTNQHLILSAY
jgi:hypothetical protein